MGMAAPLQLFAAYVIPVSATQFKRLIDFLTEAANHGRPFLLRQLAAITPLLMELGGDRAMSPAAASDLPGSHSVAVTPGSCSLPRSRALLRTEEVRPVNAVTG